MLPPPPRSPLLSLPLLTWALASSPALAQEAPGEPTPEAPAEPSPDATPEAPADTDPVPAYPRVPQLLATVPAAYPPEALAAGVGAFVLLELGIDESGAVVGVLVREGAATTCTPETSPLPCDDAVWAAFDTAAAQAARDFRFDPALDEQGVAVTGGVYYRYRFDAARAPLPSLSGLLLDADTGLPLANIDVVLTRDGAGRTARTDAQGRFALAGLDDGEWAVAASAQGYLSSGGAVAVAEGTVAELTLRLAPATPIDIGRGEVIEVVGERRGLEVIERRIDADEIRYLPGTGGDVVRAVQNLPGVARAPLGTGTLIIRGTPPEDSSYFLDGASIPIVFHFAGFSTILPSDAIAEVAYLPGNYGVRYGRTLGGVVDIRTREEPPEASRGYVSADLIQATLFAEQRIGDKWTVSLSGRRSYVDAVLNPILNAASDAAIRAPVYYDVQARVMHKPDAGGVVDVLALFSDDRFRVLSDDENGDAQVAIGLSTTFARLRGRWLKPLSDGWENELSASFGPDEQKFEFLETASAYERSLGLLVREELTREVTEDRSLGWRIGMELGTGRESFLYDVTLFSPYEEAAACFLAPAVYVEPTVRLGPLSATPGLRLDGLWYTNGYTAFAADPRLGARLELGTSLVAKAGVGSYSQFPTLRQVDPDADGNQSLHAARSIQASVGVEERVGSWLTLEGTLFYSWLDELVVGREDRFRFFTGPPPVGPFDTDPYANDGTGRVYGAEGLARLSLPKTTGLLSVTYSRSTRVNRPGDDVQLFAYDQPLVLNAILSQELGRGWRVGGRGRVASGNPYTPVVNRWFDQGSRQYVPVYGERDSDRLPTFWAVDARIDKEWAFKKWTLTTYLDVQNVFNTKNVDVMAWNFDYSEEDPINGLPVLPSLGIRGDFGKGR